MICHRIDEGEQFWCAGNLYRMLIPRDATKCFEVVVETIEPGCRDCSPLAREFRPDVFQRFGSRRATIGDEVRDTTGSAVAYIPQNTNPYVENSSDVPPQYSYVSIWPGMIPESDGGSWREWLEAMVKIYAVRGFPARRNSETRQEDGDLRTGGR